MHQQQENSFGPEFKIGYVKNDQQIVIRHFKHDEILSKTISDSDLRTNNLQALFAPEAENFMNLQNQAIEIGKHYPLRTQNEIGFSLEQFESMNFAEAQKSLTKINGQWALNSNLNLLENLFPILEKFKALWPNDRTTFFEELWYLLRANLGASTFVILYNGLEKLESGEKLVRIKVTGDMLPNSTHATDADNAVWQRYESEIGPQFSLVDFRVSKGEWIATATIHQSPVLIMAKVFQFNPLQKALVKSFFEGLNKK